MRSSQSIHKAAEKGTAGGGRLLPHLHKIQRAFGRHDVSRIRAYTDRSAASAAREIGASAYAMGDSVAFGKNPDLRIAAHEAAHVIQQRAGVQLPGNVGREGDIYERHADAVANHVVSGRSAEGLLNQMAPSGSRASGVQRQVLQRAPIKTDYGKFDTTKYEDVGTAGSEDGVDIELTFDPEPTKVNATKIGLTQTVRTRLAGATVPVFPIHKERAVAKGTGKGSRIDRLASGSYGNPLYAADAPAAADKLGDTATVASWGQHGWHYMDGTTEKHEKAILKDTPSVPGRTKNSGQDFETAALAVEGAQSGTYMGSVSWGWSVDGAGKFKRKKLTRVSKGKPSTAFIAAAKQWNKTSVGGTIKTTASPTNVYDNSYAVAFTVAKDTEVEVSDAAPIHKNITYSEVTIKSGTQSGSTGRIKVKDLKQTGGTAVIKLPIP